MYLIMFLYGINALKVSLSIYLDQKCHLVGASKGDFSIFLLVFCGIWEKYLKIM